MKKITFFCLLFLGLISWGNAQKKSKPDTVQIGVFVNTIYDLSMTNGECSSSFWAWLVYDDDSLKIADNFEVMNAKLVQKQASILQKVENKNWVTAKFICKLQQDWAVHNFPFDTQKVIIKLEDTEYDSRNLVFKPDIKGSKIDKSFSLAGWDIKKFEIKHKPVEYDTSYGDPSLKDGKSKYSGVEVTITIKRQSWGLFFKVFLGLYIALMISSLVFLVPANDLNSKFGLAIGGLFAAVGNKYIVDSVLPESNVFTLSDQIHALTFAFIFMYILVSALSHRLENHQKHELAKKLDRTILFLGPILYFVMNVLLVSRAMSI
jgi:hypothetical protein